ncbi:epoxide hydrolase [Venturia nashicola]|nr:epoxide hydrolase [Venturia nashicola]
MSLSSLPPRQRFISRAGHTYSYLFTPPVSDVKPTLLFLHGFPSHIPDWKNQVSHFSPLGYGIIVPDLLGYGHSSKPAALSAHKLKSMSSELKELLDHLGIEKVVGIGHDFGATLLSRIVTYYPTWFEKVVFLAVGPARPGTPFKIHEINEMTKQMLGYEMLGYIPWIVEDPTSQEILEGNAESAMSLMFCADGSEWVRWFHPLGKMREFVGEDRKVDVGEWFDEELRVSHLNTFARKDGYKGAKMWYSMWMQESFLEDEKDYTDFRVKQQVLCIVPRNSAEQQEGILMAWCDNLKTVAVEGGHWVHLENAQATNRAIEEFLKNA